MTRHPSARDAPSCDHDVIADDRVAHGLRTRPRGRFCIWCAENFLDRLASDERNTRAACSPFINVDSMTLTDPNSWHPIRPGERFRNPWPASEPHGLGDVLRFFRESRSRPRAPTPPRGSFPVATPAVAYPTAGADERRATWIGHATVLLQLNGVNLITDPMFSQRAFPVQWMGPRRVMDPGLALDRLPPLDVVLVSHNHYDHLDRPAVKRIARAHPQATWVVPLGLGGYLRGWGAHAIVELDWWQQLEVHGVRVTATPARHFSNRRLGDRNRSLWCGYALDLDGWRAWFAGDTAYHPQFGEIGSRTGPFDFAM